MTRISKAMVQRGGKRYCCTCKASGERVRAIWAQHGRDYCEAHKPEPLKREESMSEADYDIERRFGI